MKALDFATGPGRNIVKYANIFQSIDGVDIAQKNLDNARSWIGHNNLDISKHKLILCNGVDLSDISDNTYDVVFSTIAFQHICVYDIRYKYLTEIHRVLKNGGYITFQMGYGTPSKKTVGYYVNNYNALGTNRECDVAVSTPDEIKKDLESIGFENFQYKICKVGPGDWHPNWIYFNAQRKSAS